MKWTTDKPSAPGWYWTKHRAANKPEIVEISSRMTIFMVGLDLDIDLKEYGADDHLWAGPLVEPIARDFEFTVDGEFFCSMPLGNDFKEIIEPGETIRFRDNDQGYLCVSKQIRSDRPGVYLYDLTEVEL